ncbi:MAG: DUF1003 domain-containing protein [Candidatus Aenigmarchaeota archaeon]|nr:DUF1003 domain-containing protein [Candidatus Aenigmarchaeota archaeon]
MVKRAKRAIIDILFPFSFPKEITPEQLLKKLHSFEGQLAQAITTFAGSMFFVYVHIIWFGLWIIANRGGLLPYVPIFDPFPFGLLTMVVSLEAIFLATFIMITQNRQALIDTYKELEEAQEEQEAVEEVEDIQKDLDDIKRAIAFIQQKITEVEKVKEMKTQLPSQTNTNPPHQNKQ